MGLKNIPRRRSEVTIDGEKLTLRGLAFYDLGPLIEKHGQEVTMLYGAAMKDAQKTGSLTGEQVMSVIKLAAEKAPALVAHVIVLACGENAEDADALEAARDLPPTATLEILEHTFKLTFVGETEVGKALEIVTRMLEGLTGLLNHLGQPASD